MSRRRKRILIATAGFLILLGAVWYLAPTAVARGEAEIDIALGHLELRTYGHPKSFRASVRAEKALEANYGICTVFVGGAHTTSEQWDAADAYNRRMGAEIEGRFGADVIDQEYAAAEATLSARP